MSVIPLILAAEAAGQDRAVRRTAYRHRHISDNPLVIAAFNLSGEAAGPLGFCYGTRPGKSKVVVSAEPRNRESRFGAINLFSADLVEHLTPFLTLVEAQKANGQTYKRAKTAPQIVVPNRATVEYLGRRLGRSLRYLGLGDTYPVPEPTQWAGAHLSWLAEHAPLPGQSIFLSATELLTSLYATGQSSLEDENLASLLAWIENPANSGRRNMDSAEDSAYGPVPDPRWEATLEPLVKAYSTSLRDGNEGESHTVERRVQRMVRDALQPAYEATHRALRIARAIPQGRSVAVRWDGDLREWSGHARRALNGIPRFARRHDAIRAASTMEKWTSALDRLAFDEALDDPLVMAELDAEGRCASGTVTSIDSFNKEVKPGNVRLTQVPLVTVRLVGFTRLLAGDSVVWSDDERVKGIVRLVDAAEVVIAVLEGHGGGTRLPVVKKFAMFASLSIFAGRPPQDPEAVPWTHTPPVDQAATDDVDGSDSDVTVGDLAELGLVGLMSPGEVPGVVL